MSWRAEYILLIMLSTIVDYIAGLKIYNAEKKSIKKFYLMFSLGINLGLLFIFKYFNFFNDSIRAILSTFSIQYSPIFLKVILPVGISFYTFQTLSYTIDIYLGKIKPEKHLGIFAVYVSFFPQLVAGPIERAKNLLPQFWKKYDFDYKRVTDGLKLMLWGFFKKLVIADRLALIVNSVYNNVGAFNGTTHLVATVFFAFQIYCDFSGYSDIAIGAAQTMGFKLMDNFKRPYFSKSISEFWKRWHISLSSWFKDYVYIPLGGNRVSKYRWYINLFIVFLVSGLWHGASWTFVIWGALHGTYLIIEILIAKLNIGELTKINNYPLIKKGLQIITTFALVNIGWIFFRANNVTDALFIIKSIFTNIQFSLSSLYFSVVGWDGFLIAIGSILFMEFVHILQEHMSMRHFLSDKPRLVRWGVYTILLASILLFGVFKNTQFIYFQF